MKHLPSFRFFIAILITGIQQAKADDDSCVKIPCLGKRISKEDAPRVIPMLCMAAFACYEKAECIRLNDGKCGWKETPELKACVADKSKPIILPTPPQQ